MPQQRGEQQFSGARGSGSVAPQLLFNWQDNYAGAGVGKESQGHPSLSIGITEREEMSSRKRF